jgi:hypothetical protein
MHSVMHECMGSSKVRRISGSEIVSASCEHVARDAISS